jgi:hypothetical protein
VIFLTRLDIIINKIKQTFEFYFYLLFFQINECLGLKKKEHKPIKTKACNLSHEQKKK